MFTLLDGLSMQQWFRDSSNGVATAFMEVDLSRTLCVSADQPTEEGF
ncbi:hypothetical protein [Rhodopirellula bahusiensis]